MKKVIIFIPSIEEGGVEKNLYIVSNYLNKKKLDIEILTSNYDKKNHFDKGIRLIGTRNRFLQNSNRTLKYIACVIFLFFYLIKFKSKPLVFAFQANIYAIFVSKILGVKIITRANSSPSGWSKNTLKKKLYTFLINLADEVMVNSMDFKKDFYQNFKIKTTCIFNPFDKSFVKKKINNKLKTDIYKKKSLKIISIGRLTNQKDHLTLLMAAKFINLKLNPKIFIIGKGKNYKTLNNFIRNNNLENIVKLLGYKSNPFNYLKNSNVLILTSKFEGLPNVLLEGQYLKKYIISSDCPTGPKEILLRGKAGDLFKIGDYRKIAQLINDYPKNLKKISKKIKIGSKNFSRFDYYKNCQKYYELVTRNF